MFYILLILIQIKSNEEYDALCCIKNKLANIANYAKKKIIENKTLELFTEEKILLNIIVDILFLFGMDCAYNEMYLLFEPNCTLGYSLSKRLFSSFIEMKVQISLLEYPSLNLFEKRLTEFIENIEECQNYKENIYKFRKIQNTFSLEDLYNLFRHLDHNLSFPMDIFVILSSFSDSFVFRLKKYSFRSDVTQVVSNYNDIYKTLIENINSIKGQ